MLCILCTVSHGNLETFETIILHVLQMAKFGNPSQWQECQRIPSILYIWDSKESSCEDSVSHIYSLSKLRLATASKWEAKIVGQVLSDTKEYGQGRVALGVYLAMPPSGCLNPFCTTMSRLKFSRDRKVIAF